MEGLTARTSSTPCLCEERARRVTDFIAGMTDRYAAMKFKQHFFPEAWNG